MTNKHKNVLYLGVTNNLGRRVNEHKTGDFKGFTKKIQLSLPGLLRAFYEH
jgi:putative endonuclease